MGQNRPCSPVTRFDVRCECECTIEVYEVPNHLNERRIGKYWGKITKFNCPGGYLNSVVESQWSGGNTICARAERIIAKTSFQKVLKVNGGSDDRIKLFVISRPRFGDENTPFNLSTENNTAIVCCGNVYSRIEGEDSQCKNNYKIQRRLGVF